MSTLIFRWLLRLAVFCLLLGSMEVQAEEWDPISVAAAAGSRTFSVMFQFKGKDGPGGQYLGDNEDCSSQKKFLGNESCPEGRRVYFDPAVVPRWRTEIERNHAIVLEYLEAKPGETTDLGSRLFSANYRRFLLAYGDREEVRLFADGGVAYDKRTSKLGSAVRLGVDFALTQKFKDSCLRRFHLRLELDGGYYDMEGSDDFLHARVGVRLFFLKQRRAAN